MFDIMRLDSFQAQCSGRGILILIYIQNMQKACSQLVKQGSIK